LAAIAGVLVVLLRSALRPIEEQLRRIADEIEIRNTLGSDGDPTIPSPARGR
jgi:hypothetical protein